MWGVGLGNNDANPEKYPGMKSWTMTKSTQSCNANKKKEEFHSC
jgi:hypothetical protein